MGHLCAGCAGFAGIEHSPANSPNTLGVYTPGLLTTSSPNAALRSGGGKANLHNIVDSVVSSYNGEVSGLSQEKLLNYIRLLASTGKTAEQLRAFGAAYLREILEPDPRYSGW